MVLKGVKNFFGVGMGCVLIYTFVYVARILLCSILAEFCI